MRDASSDGVVLRCVAARLAAVAVTGLTEIDGADGRGRKVEQVLRHTQVLVAQAAVFGAEQIAVGVFALAI